MPELSAVGTLAAKEIGCVRPYTPDIVGFLQALGRRSWAEGENNPHINFLHSVRVGLPVPEHDADQHRAAQRRSCCRHSAERVRGVAGTNWNQPWYQPQCNVTANSFNPADDPEANTYDPNGSEARAVPVEPLMSRTLNSPNLIARGVTCSRRRSRP